MKLKGSWFSADREKADVSENRFIKMVHVLFFNSPWLTSKYKTSIKSLMRQYVKRPGEGQAKTWQLFGRSGNGNRCGIALRRLVTSRKQQFRWRSPSSNPYLISDPDRKTLTSRYREVTMAIAHA